MGGLVSREMLTNPEIGYDRSAKDALVPQVAALIMVGTPNHGSQLARLRVFTEMRDQLSRLTSGQASWLAGILDGAGDAKIDLLPGSRFSIGTTADSMCIAAKPSGRTMKRVWPPARRAYASERKLSTLYY